MLIRVGTWLIGAAVLAVGIAVWQHRQSVLAETEVEGRSLAVVSGEVASRTVQAVDIVLRDAQERFGGIGLDSPQAFRSALESREINEFLRSRAERLPQVDALTLIAGDGGRVNYSLSWPTPSEDYSDRAVLHHFATAQDLHLYISEPLVSRTTGLRSLMLARGVYGPAGQFVGVVVATLPLSAFADFFASITLPTVASFMLARRDGTVLVRRPDIGDRAGERMPQGSPWYRLAAAGGGSYTSPGYFDGVERLIAVQPLADYPLVMDVGLDKQSALAGWRVETVAVAAGTLVASGILLLLLHALRLQFIRLQRSRRTLVERNFDLTRTEARLQAASGELATTLAAMDQGLLMVDAEGTVAVCNARAEEMLELPAGLMASRPAFIAIAACSAAADAANAVPARAVGNLPAMRCVPARPRPERCWRCVAWRCRAAASWPRSTMLPRGGRPRRGWCSWPGTIRSPGWRTAPPSSNGSGRWWRRPETARWWRCFASASTASRRSMTPLAIRPATSCCGGWPSG